MRYLLLHTSAWDPTSVGPALERAQIEARQARVKGLPAEVVAAQEGMTLTL